MITLTFKTVPAIDFSGMDYYIGSGQRFDADDFAEANSINRSDMSQDDVNAVQAGAASLNPGEFLRVDFEA